MDIKTFLDKYGRDTSTNFDLLSYAKDLNIPNFHVLMRNELKKLKRINNTPVYIICNYQTTSEKGSHWIGLYKNKTKDIGYYFDSFSISPFKEAIDFMQDVNDRCYSTFEIQSLGTKICGQICLYVLFKLSVGEDFYSTILDLYSNKNEL